MVEDWSLSGSSMIPSNHLEGTPLPLKKGEIASGGQLSLCLGKLSNSSSGGGGGGGGGELLLVVFVT